MSPKILGKPGVESLLEKTVLSTNAGLGEESQLPPELHNLLRESSGNKAPTNMDAWVLYNRAFKKVILGYGSAPKEIGPKEFGQFQTYLNAAEIFLSAISYAESSKLPKALDSL